MTCHHSTPRLRSAWLLTLLLLLALVPAAATNAAAAESEAEAAPAAAVPVEDPTADEQPAAAPGSDEPGNASGDGTAPTDDAETTPDQGPVVFVPTEEISEDFAVAFPVDI